MPVVNHEQKHPHPKAEMSGEAVRDYLRMNPTFLDNYVLSSAVTIDTVNRWISRKQGKRAAPSSSRNVPNDKTVKNEQKNGGKMNKDWKIAQHALKRRQLLELSTVGGDLSLTNRNFILDDLLASCIQVCLADGGNLYLVEKDTQYLYLFDSKDQTGNSTSLMRPESKASIAAHVAKNAEFIRIQDISKDTRFPEGIAVDCPAQSVICQPIIDTSGVLLGVLELYRQVGRNSFTERDEEICSIVNLWGSFGVYFSQLFHSMSKQRKQNDFLLNVTKSIFQDIVSMDSVVMKIMNFAQKLVNADRASLFLVDGKTNELYARIFDVGTGLEADTLEINGQKEIRFPMDVGIAGHVASTGQILNIEDAYTDQRFNRDVDVKTGYTTKTILCMPIYIRGSIIGVVQMVNKVVGGVFTRQDEEAFETFAIYCGLALHHAKLYDKIRRSEQKYRVALEVLAYHSVANRDEIAKLKKHNMPEKVAELSTFDVHPLRLSEIEKPLFAVHMFKDLFGVNKVDEDDLIRFVLTVRKNYRRVAYHNWTHGWSVAHGMYVILKKDTESFTFLERLAMYIGCLCHDLDHRGKNNAYMKNMSTPLASIYSTSVMEHHHFNQTVTILQQEGHNIFKNFTSEEYKWLLSNIKHCILATDLALFFPNKAKMKKMIDDQSFSWKDKQDRLLVQAVSMTACDLIAAAKPWSVQTDTVKVIFEEFYEQGDAERANGREPIPMMDREKSHELPQMQVGFMSGIVVPCYETLVRALPCIESLVDKSKHNLAMWQGLADEQKKKQAFAKT